MNIKDAIFTIISEKKISTQAELVNELKAQGILAEQSTISRQFKKLGVYKALDGNKIYYKIMQNSSSQQSIKPFIKSINKNEALIVIKTNDGAASMVGDFIDKLKIDTILGSIAGDNTIFITTHSIQDINSTYTFIEENLI